MILQQNFPMIWLASLGVQIFDSFGSLYSKPLAIKTWILLNCYKKKSKQDFMKLFYRLIKVKPNLKRAAVCSHRHTKQRMGQDSVSSQGVIKYLSKSSNIWNWREWFIQVEKTKWLSRKKKQVRVRMRTRHYDETRSSRLTLMWTAI